MTQGHTAWPELGSSDAKSSFRQAGMWLKEAFEYHSALGQGTGLVNDSACISGSYLPAKEASASKAGVESLPQPLSVLGLHSVALCGHEVRAQRNPVPTLVFGSIADPGKAGEEEMLHPLEPRHPWLNFLCSN